MTVAELKSLLLAHGLLLASGKTNPNASKVLEKKYPELLNQIIALTSFLSSATSLAERMYCIKNMIVTQPMCQLCNTNPVKFVSNKYHLYCSNVCSTQSKGRQQKIKDTSQKRYGVDHFSKTDLFKNKTSLTNIKKYGVCHPAKTKEWQQNRVNTCIARYGDGSSIQKKLQQTKQERYGNSYYNNHQQAVETNIQKRGVKYTSQDPTVRECKISTCIDKYGVDNPRKSDIVKTKIRQTLVERYGRINYSQVHISNQTLLKLEDRDWLIDQHHNQKHNLFEISKVLGVDHTTISNYFKKHGISVLSYPTSSFEKEISDFIRNLLPSARIVQNNRTILSPQEIDIYLPDYNLAIECCGLYWHADIHPRITREYHADKTRRCGIKGIRLITIFEDEWTYKPEIAKAAISHILKTSTQSVAFARDCKIVMVDTTTKRNFFDKNHIQGDGPGSLNIGLELTGGLVAVMSFIKQQNRSFLLNRYATSCRVPGGFSKLLKYFESNFDWSTIITFADLRWSTGQLYSTHGFVVDKNLPVDYQYILNNKRVHKFNFRRANLEKMLEHFDPKLSEHQNCANHNILRIWDCGKIRFVKQNDKKDET